MKIIAIVVALALITGLWVYQVRSGVHVFGFDWSRVGWAAVAGMIIALLSLPFQSKKQAGRKD